MNLRAMLPVAETLLNEHQLFERRVLSYGLRFYGDPSLRVPAVRVEESVGVPSALIEALKREMQRHRGVGMASQQVGGTERVCICDFMLPRRLTVMINPIIVATSIGRVLCIQEGCLSVPGFRTSVHRHDWVDVEWQDESFQHHKDRLRGFDAQVVQHELDHLDGVCIADRVSRQQRRQAERLVAAALSALQR